MLSSDVGTVETSGVGSGAGQPVSSSARANESKRRLRDEFLRRLSGLSFLDLIGKSGSLSDHFFAFVRTHEPLIRGKYIISFCPFGNEPQINIEKEGGREPYRVAYVRVEDWAGRRMSARAARRDTPDLWEVIEPQSGVRIDQPLGSLPEVVAQDIGIILVPAIAFTREGKRLGRGAGFYDRFLRGFPQALRLGIAFAEQLSNSLPEEEWDERVDIILTDQEKIPMNSYGDWTKHGKIIHRNQE